ncbi:MAG: SoxR reducing system RseC family protein [Gammaproteobacteria bacterium]
MIEERAIVSRTGDDGIWVRALGPESCPRCAAGRGCGGGVLGRLVSRRRPEIRVNGALAGLRSGDTVVVGVDEGALMRASLWVYLVPLLCMLAAGGVAQLVLQAHDLLVAALGLVGLAGGFALTRLAAGPAQASLYQPTLLRREPAGTGACARIEGI